MTQQDRNNGNKVIAKFMGGQLRLITHTMSSWHWSEIFRPEWKGQRLMENKLEFHSSIAWLMPVVTEIEKIQPKENIGVSVFDIQYLWEKGKHRCLINYKLTDNGVLSEHKSFDIISDSKIEAIWLAVVQFIEWYNKEKNKQLCSEILS